MRRFALVVVVLLVVAACGDAATDTTSAPAATSAPVPTAAPTTTPPTTPPPTTTPPTTTPPTTTPPTTEAGIVPGEDADVDAVVTAYQVAFDSVSPFEEKAPYIDDPTGLESTVSAYITTGESFGGIEVVVTGVTISGDEAAVTYDLLFSGNPTYPDLEGSAVKTGSGWQVPRSVFCGLMSSARVPCS